MVVKPKKSKIWFNQQTDGNAFAHVLITHPGGAARLSWVDYKTAVQQWRVEMRWRREAERGNIFVESRFVIFPRFSDESIDWFIQIYLSFFLLHLNVGQTKRNQSGKWPILGARQEMARWKLPQLACKFGSVILQLNWAHCNWHTNLRISSGRVTRVKRVDFDLAGFADVYRSLFWLQSSHTTARMTVGR